MGKEEVYLSIVVPIYKAEEYLAVCIESILKSTFRDFELILVDDGSPDCCGEICDRYAQRDKRIQVIHKQNAGVAEARNDGIRSAKGKWLAFVDDDDYVKEDFFQGLVELTYGRETDMVIGNHMEAENGKKMRRVPNLKSFSLEEKNDIQKARAAVFGAELAPEYTNGFYGMGYPWDKLYKMSIIRANKVVFQHSAILGEDVMFVSSYMKHIGGVLCESSLFGYCHRIMKESGSHGFVDLEKITNTLHVLQKEIGKETEDIVKEGLYVQMVRMLATAWKRFFMNPRSGLGKVSGLKAFFKWKKAYVESARKARNKYLPWKLRVFRLMI